MIAPWTHRILLIASVFLALTGCHRPAAPAPPKVALPQVFPDDGIVLPQARTPSVGPVAGKHSIMVNMDQQGHVKPPGFEEALTPAAMGKARIGTLLSRRSMFVWRCGFEASDWCWVLSSTLAATI